MMIPERLHLINDTVCFFVGTPVNALLIWLIVHCTPKDMATYRPILLLSAITDVAYLAVYWLVVPVMAIKEGRGGMLSLGPLGDAPQPWGFVLIAVWMFFLFFSQYSLCVPFVYRYFVLCCDKTNWGRGVFLAMLLVPFTLCVIHSSLLFPYAGYTHDVYAANAFYGFNKTYSVPYFSPSRERNKSSIILVITIAGLNYILVFLFSHLIHRYLSRMAITHLSVEHRIRSLNRQVSKALLLQALIPFTIEYLPSMSMAIAAVSGVTLGDSSTYMTASIAWIPVLNPLVSIWMVGAYRRQLIKWLLLLKRIGVKTLNCSRSRSRVESPPQWHHFHNDA